MSSLRPPLRVMCAGEYDVSGLCRSALVTSKPSAKYWYSMPDELAFDLPDLQAFLSLYPDPKADPAANPRMRWLLERGKSSLALSNTESSLSERSVEAQQSLWGDWTNYMNMLVQRVGELMTKVDTLDPNSMTNLHTDISQISQLLQLSYQSPIITQVAGQTQKSAESIITWHREYCYLKAMDIMDLIAKMYSSRKTEIKYFASALWQSHSPKSFDLRNLVLMKVLHQTLNTLSEAAKLLEFLAWQLPTYEQLTTHWNLGVVVLLNDRVSKWSKHYVKQRLQRGFIIWDPSDIDARLPNCWPGTWLESHPDNDSKFMQIAKETAWRMKEQVRPMEELQLNSEIARFNSMPSVHDHEELILEQGSIVMKMHLIKIGG